MESWGVKLGYVESIGFSTGDLLMEMSNIIAIALVALWLGEPW